MTNFAADRNLLTGVLGLQTALFSESQLISAMQAWVFNKEKPLEELLLAQGALTAERRAFLVQLVEQYLLVNGQSPATALTKLPARQDLAKTLEMLHDAEVSSCISWLGSAATAGRTTKEIEQATEAFQYCEVTEDNRFRIIRPHARGGLGIVSVAEDCQLHREVALKQIKPDLSGDTESRNRFLVEAEVTGRLEHPSIVPVYSLGFTADGPYYVMRFIRGESLKEAIERLYDHRARLTPSDYQFEIRKLVGRLKDVGNALAYAHSRGVLHRDVKPSNIMLGKFGETLLVDWGLAKTGAQRPSTDPLNEPTFVPQSGDSSSETRFGAVVGTLSYMSPEQAQGRLDLIGPGADVYSLGATLYCILTGSSPFDGSSKKDTLQRVQQNTFEEAILRNPQTSKSINAICLKAMAGNISDRYLSVSDMLNDLELWLADEPVSVYVEPLVERVLRAAKRHRTLVAFTSALVLTSVAGLFGLNLLTQHQNQQLKIAKDDADHAREIAEENLNTVQELSLVMLKNAEQKLSHRDFLTNPVTRSLRTELTEAAVSTFQKVLPQFTPTPSVLADFAQVLRTSANLKRLGRNFEVANQQLEQSIELQERVTAEQRTEQQTDYLAETYRDMAALRKSQGDLTGASESIDRADQLATTNAQRNPTSQPLQRTVAVNLIERAALQMELGKTDPALAAARKAVEILELIIGSDEAKSTDHVLVLIALARFVHALGESGEFEEAENVASQAIDLATTFDQATPNDGNILIPWTRILFESAEFQLVNGGTIQLAEERLKAASEKLATLASQTKLASQLSALADAQRHYATFLRQQGRLEEAATLAEAAQSTMDKLVKASPSPGFLSLSAEVLLEFAKIKLATQQSSEAKPLLEQAQSRQQEAVNQSPQSVVLKKTMLEIQQELQRL